MEEIWHREGDLHQDNLKYYNYAYRERQRSASQFFLAAFVRDWVENNCIAFYCEDNSVRDCQYTLLDMCHYETFKISKMQPTTITTELYNCSVLTLTFNAPSYDID